MKIGTLTTGAAENTWPLTFVPQALFYVAAVGQLTSLRIDSVDFGTVLNLDSDGLDAIAVAGHIDRVTNGYFIQIATGKLEDTKIDIVTLNAGAQTPTLFGLATGRGDAFVQAVGQKALADSGITLSNFSRAYFPNAAAADIFNITFKDGLNYKWTREELQAFLAISNDVLNASDDYLIDNSNQNIKSVQFIPAADQQIYVQRLVPIGITLPVDALS